MMALYRVTNWNEYFETHKTRILKRMDWVSLPNKMDGDGYTELVDHVDGAAHYGVWCALLLVASKCDPRGTLARSGADPAFSGARAAHDGASLARVTRLPLSLIQSAIPRLLKIGWLEESGADPAFSGADPAETGRRMVRNGMEGKGREGNPLADPKDSESILRKIAEDCPDQQDFESGVDCAVRALMSSANPATTLRTMQDNLPLWWAAMREGRARVKPMRFVIVDKDYLRPPGAGKSKLPLAGTPGVTRSVVPLTPDEEAQMYREFGEEIPESIRSLQPVRGNRRP